MALLLRISDQSFLNLKRPSKFAVMGPESALPLVASVGKQLETLHRQRQSPWVVAPLLYNQRNRGIATGGHRQCIDRTPSGLRVGSNLARSSIGRWELFLPMHRIDPLPVGLGDLVAACPVDS